MNRVYTCLGKTISLEFPSNWENNLQKVDFWIKRFCPVVELSYQSNNVDYIIRCVDSTKYGYNIGTKQIVITGKWSEFESFLGKFITQVFQNLLVDDDIFFMPAACVINNNSAILIIGDFWQGKTSVAMNFAKRKGLILMSDNYVAIKNDKVIGGTNYLSIRKETPNASFDFNQSIFLFDGRYYFQNKQNIGAGELSIQGILTPHINASGNDFHFVSYNESVWFVYQKLTRLINGEAVLFIDKLPSPNFNDKKKSQKFLACTTRLLDSCGLLFASAPIDLIIDRSMELFNQ